MLNLRNLKIVTVIPKILSNSCRNLGNAVSITPNITNKIINQEIVNKSLIESFLVKPENIGLNIGIRNPNFYKEIYDLPLTNKVVENPNKNINIIEDVLKIEKIVDLPAINGINKDENDVGKQAARLIVIRRRKMKKHKLKKLRKKMRFVWAKVRQRRELRKEKRFQARLMKQIKEAEKFSAEQYVTEKLRQATEKPLPRFWKGRRLPAFIIKEKLKIFPDKFFR